MMPMHPHDRTTESVENQRSKRDAMLLISEEDKKSNIMKSLDQFKQKQSAQTVRKSVNSKP